MTSSVEPNIAGAQAAAARLIRSYGIRLASEIAVDDIAWDRGVRVRYGTLDGIEAYLLRRGTQGLIRVNDDIPENGRKRFSVAHELGHWELHAHLSQEWLCTSADIHAYRGSAAELEANAFAASLLMPGAIFEPALRAGLGMSLVGELAEKFGTTITATAVRAVELVNEDAYVVFSRGGIVRWWQRNPQNSGYFIRRLHPLHSDSVALWAENSPSEVREAQQVPFHAWFCPTRDRDPAEVWEESVFIGQYDTVISLLTIV